MLIDRASLSTVGGRQRGVIVGCETTADVVAALQIREQYLTKLNLGVLRDAAAADPALAPAMEERI